MRRAGALTLRDRPFGSLSGGQRQRVLLSRALASGPLLLVLDEPTSGLDPQAAEALWTTVDELRDGGAGILAVTHDLVAAMPYATHVLAMGDGSAAFRTATHEGGDAA